MIVLLSSLLVLLAGATNPIKSFAQDPVTGLYTLVYVDAAGATQRVQVVPADRVDVVVRVDVQAAASGQYVFSFGIENRGSLTGSKAVVSLEVPCPQNASPTSVTAGWSKHVGRFRNARSCSFFRGPPRLQPGKLETGLVVTSSNLPAISPVTVQGDAAPVDWPSDESTPQEAYAVADRVGLGGGGGRDVVSLAPIRPIAVLADPLTAVPLIRSDLAQACKLGWVDNEGVCNSLDVKLSGALDGPTLKLQALEAFLNELSAQHNKHVSQEAFALLSVNVKALIDQATAPR
jgi:hypothetical protein